MKRKLNIVFLSFVLIMQSFFSVAPVTFADEGDTDPIVNYVDFSEVGTEELKSNEEISGTEEGESEETKYDNQQKDNNTNETDIGEIDTEQSNQTKKEEVSTLPNGNDITGPMNGGQGLMSSPLIKADFESDVTFHFDKLVTSTGKEIRNANDANDYQPAMGETINIYYTFEIMATKDYGPGSFFTFQLPQVLLAFKESTLSGDIDHGDIQLKYSTDNALLQ